MKIIIVCQTMTYLSGSPLYNYTLALELKRQGHEIDFISNWADNELKRTLQKEGIRCLNFTDETYDLALVSQRDFPIPNAINVINIVHSEYDCETPIIDGVDKWVAIRPSIKEHLIKEHGIDADKIEVIYNGVDLERFKPDVKYPRPYIKVVIPATIDGLRQKMFDYYTSRASATFRIFIYGKQFNAHIPDNEFISVNDETFNIEEHIKDADIVAGILLGRVNLEARACNVLSYIHNPDNPEEYEVFYPHRWDFEERHDIKKVADKICHIANLLSSI